MKRCPECRRDYYDDSLLYCLDDGSALLDGPASFDTAQTVLLHDTAPPKEAATLLNIHQTDGPLSAAPWDSATRMMPLQQSMRGVTERSIAVLPFRNISRDAADEYFSDGLTEEIISDLSAVRSLKVISRASSMTLKNSDKDTRTIAAELNVRYILDGSVRKAGDQLRISAQLIDGMSDENLWADKYSGTLSDIFEIQESVSRSIVDALKITLSAAEECCIADRPIENPVAYDLYLRARAEFVKGSPDALDRAIDLLEKGLSIIGDNELILASLGYAHYHYFRWVSKLDRGHLEKAREYMRRTFAFNPDASHGHVLKGLLAYSEGDMVETLRSLKKAVDIDPTNTEALFWYAINLNYIGRSDEAGRHADRLCELDPLLPINIAIKSIRYVYAGDFDEALVWIAKSLELDADSPLLIWTAAIVEAWAGNDEKAFAHFDRLAEIAPGWVYTQHGLFQKYAMLGQKERALEHNLPEMAQEARYDSHFALHMAECFALIDDKDTALDYLTSAVDGGLSNRRFLTEFDKFLDPLKTDKRFDELIERAEEFQKEIAATL